MNVSADIATLLLTLLGHHVKDAFDLTITLYCHHSGSARRLAKLLRVGVRSESGMYLYSGPHGKVALFLCYARLHPRAVNCRKKKCGHSNQLRPKKKKNPYICQASTVNARAIEQREPGMICWLLVPADCYSTWTLAPLSEAFLPALAYWLASPVYATSGLHRCCELPKRGSFSGPAHPEQFEGAATMMTWLRAAAHVLSFPNVVTLSKNTRKRVCQFCKYYHAGYSHICARDKMEKNINVVCKFRAYFLLPRSPPKSILALFVHPSRSKTRGNSHRSWKLPGFPRAAWISDAYTAASRGPQLLPVGANSLKFPQAAAQLPHFCERCWITDEMDLRALKLLNLPACLKYQLEGWMDADPQETAPDGQQLQPSWRHHDTLPSPTPWLSASEDRILHNDNGQQWSSNVPKDDQFSALRIYRLSDKPNLADHLEASEECLFLFGGPCLPLPESLGSCSKRSISSRNHEAHSYLRQQEDPDVLHTPLRGRTARPGHLPVCRSLSSAQSAWPASSILRLVLRPPSSVGGIFFCTGPSLAGAVQASSVQAGTMPQSVQPGSVARSISRRVSSVTSERAEPPKAAVDAASD
eukprot:SM000089S23800  [mRNA]  locus=s89:130:6221:+ [translate_table: standard]